MEDFSFNYLNMKRAFFIILIIALALVPTFFVLIEQSNEIRIENNFFNVLEQLNYPSNWIKWQPSLLKVSSKDSASCRIKDDAANKAFSIETSDRLFFVKKITPLNFKVEEKIKKNTSVYEITVVSTTLPNRTNIVITSRISLFDYIFHNNKKTAADNTAVNLKSFLENSLAYYGYAIRIENVVDTTVVVTKKIVLTQKRQEHLLGMYNDLAIFIRANHLVIMQPKIASFKIISTDSTEIMAGIPVNKTARSTSYIECLKMPKGRMLVGEYKGSYTNSAGLSNAMEKYIRDHMMVSVAVAYEKYLDNTIPASDTSVIRLKMYYPVF